MFLKRGGNTYGSHKTKGCQKIVKSVVKIESCMVVTLKVVKVVSADNEKVK